jgi:hypothetical protein
MRRVLLTLLTLAIAVPALAAQPPAQPPKPKPKAVAIQAPVEAPSIVLAAPIPLAASRPGGDALQCKSTCSRILYFCASSGDDDGCSSRWAQCSAACSATYSPVKFGR